MALTKFPNGLSSFGVPVMGGSLIPPTTGKYVFVDSNTGSNGNSGLDKDHAVATLAYAITLTTASKGDVIILMPGHAETVSTTITPKAGNTIVGLGVGRNRAVFTASTGSIDTFTLSASNVRLQNFVIAGAASGVTALVEISGTDAQLVGMEIQGAAAPVTLITISNATALRPVFKDCVVRAAAGTATIISPEVTGTCAEDMLIENLTVHGSSVRDIDTSIIKSVKKNCTGMIVNGVVAVGIVADQQCFDFNSSTGVVDGMIANCELGWDAGGTIANLCDVGGMVCSGVRGTDDPGAAGIDWPSATSN
jgi:hypothetical protein